MKLLRKQEHAVYYLKDRTTTELVYGGAAGGGKSALGCLWLIECCQKYPGTRWLMGRAKLKRLKETTLETFFEVSKKLGINDQYKYNENKSTITWNNGSKIYLKELFFYPSDPEFDDLGSLEITGAFIDEISQIVFKAWEVVGSRCRFRLNDFTPCGHLTKDLEAAEYDDEGMPVKWILPSGEISGGLKPKTLGTCNPSKKWVYKHFYLASKNGTLKKKRKFIQALPTDNKHLSREYLETLLNMEENSRQRLYYGNWEYDDDPATLIDIEAIHEYFNPIHIDKVGKQYLTIDVARKGKDKSVVRRWHGWLCVERKEYPKNKITELAEYCKEQMRKHGIPKSRTVADEDGVGGGLVDMLDCEGFVNNGKAMNDENFANLKSQCSIHMAKKIMDREAGEECESTQIMDLVGEEMEQVKEDNIDKDGPRRIISKDIMKQNLGRSPDDWDSIMMRYYFKLKPVTRSPKSRVI